MHSLRATHATGDKDSEQVEAKQAEISITTPFPSFALSFQGVEVAVFLLVGSTKQHQRFSTK